MISQEAASFPVIGSGPPHAHPLGRAFPVPLT
jgi:hypothetical protein